MPLLIHALHAQSVRQAGITQTLLLEGWRRKYVTSALLESITIKLVRPAAEPTAVGANPNVPLRKAMNAKPLLLGMEQSVHQQVVNGALQALSSHTIRGNLNAFRVLLATLQKWGRWSAPS